jgi:hypothetical protein
MADIDYELSASECGSCARSVLVPAEEEAPHCYFCGRVVQAADPARYSNLNATMQRLASFARESKVFDKANTNTSMARLGIEEIGRFMIDFLVMNEASIRYGYYGKPGEYERKMLDRTRDFLDALEKAYAAAKGELTRPA